MNLNNNNQKKKKNKTVNDIVNFFLGFGAAVHCSSFSYELLSNFV